MKRRKLIFRSIGPMLVLLIGLLIQQVQAIDTPWLHVDGKYIKDPAGNIVILRGVSLLDISVADHSDRTARQRIDMAINSGDGWYSRVVRLPVYPQTIDKQPGWTDGPDNYFRAHLDPAVQYCISKGIYCIIDWHYIADYQGNDSTTRTFWNYVAPKYKDYPNVIFELYNEPIYPDDWNTWKNTAQAWVDMIRAVAPNNLILVSGPRWAQNLGGAVTNPISGGNIVYVAHIYPGHPQSEWQNWFGNTADKYPVFITEWGYQTGAGSPCSGTQSGYGDPFKTYIEGKGNISWTAWVFDRYWQPTMFGLSWNLLSGDGYMGQFVKDWLYARRNDNLPSSASPTPTVTPTTTPGNKGDLNSDGNVNSTDMALMNQYLLGRQVNINPNAADLNSDNQINSTDSAMLKRKVLGM